VIVVPLAGMCIRLGNLINSEIIGTVTSVPWAFIFVQEDQQPRHPAQLYEAIYCLFLFLFMYWFWKNKRNTVGPGFMFGMFCVVLFVERFIDEFFKEDQATFEGSLPLNMGQILSIPFIIIGIIMVIRSRKMEPGSYKRRTPQTVEKPKE
jgi:phosphatidylglycerol---prolipoprotein diacylglyceryl transferase